MAWTLSSDRAIYLQIIEILELRIISGEYAPGERLPSVRDLAVEAGVNPNTMQKSMSELESDGIITSQRTLGRFVTTDTALISQKKRNFLRNELATLIAKTKALGYSKTELINIIQEL